MEYTNTQKIKRAMHNITINIPTTYDEGIQKLIAMKLIASRSEGIRIALREFLNREYGENLEILGYSVKKEEKEEKSE